MRLPWAKEKNERAEPDLCRGPLFSKMILFSLPVLASNLLQLFYNAADLIIIGRFAGDTAFSAVGSTGSLTNLILCVIIGLSVGTSSVVARHYGAGNEKAVSRSIHTSVLLGIVCGAVMAVFGFFFSEPLLRLTNVPENVLPLAVLYMRIIFVGQLFASLYNFTSAILRAIGDTRHPMNYLIISGIVNIVLNYIFVAIVGMTVDGVAYATVISQALSVFLSLRLLMKRTDCCRFDPRALRFHPTELRQIVQVGIPAGIQTSAFSLSNVLIQSSVNTFGEAAIAGFEAAATVDNFIYMSQNSMYHTSLTFVGQNYGARKLDRIKKSVLYSLGIVTVLGLFIGVFCYFFGPSLLHVFVDGAEAVGFGMERLRITAFTYVLCGYMEVGSGILRGIDRSFISMAGSIFGSCIFRIIWIFTIFRVYRSIFMLTISYPATWLLTSLIHFTVFFFCYRSLRREFAVEKVESKTA